MARAIAEHQSKVMRASFKDGDARNGFGLEPEDLR
jgi:hypothetical protein